MKKKKSKSCETVPLIIMQTMSSKAVGLGTNFIDRYFGTVRNNR
jgi:hypothetical protein